MIAAGNDFQNLPIALAGYPIDEAMVTGDAPGPPSRQITLQRLRFADALKGRSLHLGDEPVEAAEHFEIGLRPEIVFPTLFGKSRFHPLCSAR
jgi:hypothetical protein